MLEMSQMTKTGSCKMIAKNINLMTSSEIISGSLHTHFQASAWAPWAGRNLFKSLKLIKSEIAKGSSSSTAQHSQLKT